MMSGARLDNVAQTVGEHITQAVQDYMGIEQSQYHLDQQCV